MTIRTIILIVCLTLNLISNSQTLKYNVYFKTDSFIPAAKEIEKLNVFIKSLDTLKIHQINIKGYTDDIGYEEKNYLLGFNRAIEIKRILVVNQVQEFDSITPASVGEVNLDIQKTKSLEEIRKKNRTVEISLNYTLKSKDAIKPIRKTLKNTITAQQKVGDKILFDKILFEGGTHNLLPESNASLKKLAQLLTQNKKYHVNILGHICCKKGNEDGIDEETGQYNLSEARAKAVYEFLIENKIDANRLQYKGLKSLFPLGGEQKFDRRVEIEITKIDIEEKQIKK